MAKSKAHWAVTCKKHGMEEKGGAGVRWVKVSPPKGKFERQNGGCPRCKGEQLAEERLAKLDP